MRRNSDSESIRTFLKISHDKFKEKLTEQILVGKKIYDHDGTFSEMEKDYSQWDDYNNEYLKVVFNIVENEYRNKYIMSTSSVGVKEVMFGVNINEPRYKLWKLKRKVEIKINELESLKLRTDLIPIESENNFSLPKNSNEFLKDGPAVFIIHGYNNEMKKSVQVFLSRCELKDVVLHEQPDKSRTIIEKLIEEGATANYVIAVLSPDDLQSDGTLRARQNVILEIGYFIGKLGRDKVRLLIKESTSIPSDLQGILYDNYDSEGAWRINLAKEIMAVGIPINIDKLISKF